MSDGTALMRTHPVSPRLRAAAAGTLALLATLPARADDGSAQPALAGAALEAFVAQARAAVEAKRPPAAPPAGAVLGVYDPATKTFTPSAAIEPQAIARGTATIRPIFVFKSGEARDYATISCSYTIYSGSAAAKTYNTSTGQQFYSWNETPKSVALSYVYDTSRTDNTVRVSVSCTALDGDNVGHSFQAYKSFPASSAKDTFTVTVTF